MNLYVDTIGSSYDTVLAVWKGTPGGLTLVACNDDISTYEIQSKLGFYAQQDTHYYVEVIEFAQPAPQAQAITRTLNLHVEKGTFSAVDVTIAGDLKGSYAIEYGQQKVENYEGLFGGPVVVEGSGGIPIIAALRDLWTDPTGNRTSYVQVMGMPSSQLTDKYVFPTYSNVVLNEQLRFANVGTADTYVTVTIEGVEMPGSPYLVHPNEQVVRNYAGVFGGPVVVQSSGSVPIIAALRDLWTDSTGKRTSYSQVMGMPYKNLSDKFVFPTYSNVVLNEQLRIAVP
jgi:hypothetical protein